MVAASRSRKTRSRGENATRTWHSATSTQWRILSHTLPRSQRVTFTPVSRAPEARWAARGVGFHSLSSFCTGGGGSPGRGCDAAALPPPSGGADGVRPDFPFSRLLPFSFRRFFGSLRPSLAPPGGGGAPAGIDAYNLCIKACQDQGVRHSGTQVGSAAQQRTSPRANRRPRRTGRPRSGPATRATGGRAGAAAPGRPRAAAPAPSPGPRRRRGRPRGSR